MTQMYTRHPLNLPPGSVRALLALMITVLFVALVGLPSTQIQNVPLFAYPLLSLLPVFVVAHGRSIASPDDAHPLHLPRGLFRLLITGMIVGVVVWKFATDPETLLARLKPKPEQLDQWPTLVAALGGGFLAGRLSRFGPWVSSAMYQDFLAWVSLLCMFGLGALTLLVIFVEPQLPNGLNLPILQACLTAAVAFYFGARS